MIEIVKILPTLPNHKMSINKRYDKSSGFLTAKSADVTFEYSSAINSNKNMTIDYVDRKGLDAVCIVAWASIEDETYVYLRSCIRPAIELRDWGLTGRPNDGDGLNQWELPAGIIDSDETGDAGVYKAASRELKEEVGGYVSPSSFEKLGHHIFSSVGISGERIYFCHTELHPRHVEKAILDGSPLEDNAEIILINIESVLDAIDEGKIRDSKTIIAIQRFAMEIGYEL